MDRQQAEFDDSRPAELDGPPVLHPVVVVGAGPVGMTLALDLAQRLQASGQRVLLLDNDNKLSTGSRAICFAKRTLEIFDRLGVGQPLVDAGVSWNLGRVFFGSQAVYSFDLLPQAGQAMTQQRPAFINLQQYAVEGALVQRALAQPNLSIRWKHRVCGLAASAGHVALEMDTSHGRYTLHAQHLAACDGARSTLRALMGLHSTGRTFQDRFLIADVHIEGELFEAGRSERWFWFDPPFHPGQSVLLHRQPAGVWRIDFQLGWQADPEAEKRP
jgi:3-(3-hydroxy-phenyl)propionate hydroxylase